MGDYGIKTSKKGESALSNNLLDIIMTSHFPFTKIDQTNVESFRNTTVNFINNIPINTPILIHSFKHGYDYKPQVWGLWNITFGPGSLTPGLIKNGYGIVTNVTGIPLIMFWYEYDEQDIKLYVSIEDPFESGLVDLTGTTAVLTTYVFADDLTAQDYTV